MIRYINKYKAIKYTIKFLVCIFFIIFIALFIFCANGLFEKGAVKSEIANFKARAVFEKEAIIQGQNVSFYQVAKEYEYEDTTRFIYDSNRVSNCYIGSKTDIIITNRNPLRNFNVAIVSDIAGIFAQNFFVGHATINIEDDGSKCIESVGNDKIDNGVRIIDNNWIDTEVRYGNDAQTIIGLRLKNTTAEKRNEISEDLLDLLGYQYNYMFMFYSKNKYYCTDLISRVLMKNGIRVNYDSFYTTGNDLIVSNETYIIFLCERIKEGYFNIYYLSEV